jgi:acetoin utilization deacetylase AcuC-like enzyme
MLTEESYAAMAATMRMLSRELDAPLGFVLEGGYDLEALAASVAATIEGALDAPVGDPVEPGALVARARGHYQRWWPVLAN